MVRPIGERDDDGGRYKGTEKEAARAYDAAFFCLRGNSAKLNFHDNPPDIAGAGDLTTAQIKEVDFRHAGRVAEKQGTEVAGVGLGDRSGRAYFHPPCVWTF
ncbi:ERF017 protein [Hibiscus syriacus]|uniref:ERF017 protein n=1 Tax=Hibiscus syriacus TaxID=106335 RepID=A0A6A3A7L8_HIBSY|nr:ERF017 protein [Hibiscus syriacus]